MKHISSLLLLVFIITFSMNAQQLENSTLWKISGNGLEKPSYLFGTIHITCDASLDNDIKKALDETTQLVLELDMDDPKMQSQLMKGMYMTDGKTLKDLVSEEEFTAIDSLFIKQAGMSIGLIQNMKPFFLTSMLYPKMIDCQMESFELELMKVTKEQNEDVYGLETIKEQLQVFESIPYKDQVADLIRMAKDNLEYDKATFAEILEVYKSKNITEMLNMMDNENNEMTAKHQDVLLKDRNINWIPKIEVYAKQQPTFFGVGAGHLAGENGVIKLLRKAGYSVSAVL
ncbi:TraB/GumN family protein [Pontimicrobium aquaticum]|uniref:TraB/GumN family protein n=1 Tax=Pontimicrobium aquaticum TaxID=2565367 RepID=A0A4U0EVU9_9FLAO|nr:TraB/GumN family protein [Pontimicrobium aquaticum]TJY36051.1 TraB/GumN family protein [Pontimicrobium aquaticum]